MRKHLSSFVLFATRMLCFPVDESAPPIYLKHFFVKSTLSLDKVKLLEVRWFMRLSLCIKLKSIKQR